MSTVWRKEGNRIPKRGISYMFHTNDQNRNGLITLRSESQSYHTFSTILNERKWKGDECSEENSREHENANLAMERTQNAWVRRRTTILPMLKFPRYLYAREQCATRAYAQVESHPRPPGDGTQPTVLQSSSSRMHMHRSLGSDHMHRSLGSDQICKRGTRRGSPE